MQKPPYLIGNFNFEIETKWLEYTGDSNKKMVSKSAFCVRAGMQYFNRYFSTNRRRNNRGSVLQILSYHRFTISCNKYHTTHVYKPHLSTDPQ